MAIGSTYHVIHGEVAYVVNHGRRVFYTRPYDVYAVLVESPNGMDCGDLLVAGKDPIDARDTAQRWLDRMHADWRVCEHAEVRQVTDWHTGG